MDASSYKGYRIPAELLYDLEYNVWVKVDGQTATVGATEPAQAYAGEVIFIKAKPAGTRVERGAILATIESAKFMGPMRAPLSGTVAEVNEGVISNPSLVNSDPYANWVVRLSAERLGDELKLLIGGTDALERYKAVIDEWGIEPRNT